jgi:hypothetical protein
MRKNRKETEELARGVLRAVSVRIPLLVYGTDISDKVTLNNFNKLFDDDSWTEFMPGGFHKVWC